MAVPVSLHYRGGGTTCSRSDLSYDVFGSCWRTLIDFEPEIDWYDIAAICTNSLTIILSIYIVVASFFYSKKIIYFMSSLIILIAVSQMVMTSIQGGYTLYAGASIDSETTHKIKSSLKSSLFYYDNNSDVKEAWNNLMNSECCCGAHGFSDFESFGKDVPTVCQCNDRDGYGQHIKYRHEGCYKDCVNSSEYWYLNNGCQNHVMRHIHTKFTDMKVVEYVVIFSIACFHFLLIIIAMSSLSCSLSKKQVSTPTQHLILDDTEADNKLVGVSDRDPIVA